MSISKQLAALQRSFLKVDTAVFGKCSQIDTASFPQKILSVFEVLIRPFCCTPAGLHSALQTP